MTLAGGLDIALAHLALNLYKRAACWVGVSRAGGLPSWALLPSEARGKARGPFGTEAVMVRRKFELDRPEYVRLS